MSLVSVKTLLAGDANAPITTKTSAVEVAGKGNDGANSGGMSSVPVEIKARRVAFEASRQKFLTEQTALLASFKTANEAGRAKIREKLESNRAAFSPTWKRIGTRSRRINRTSSNTPKARAWLRPPAMPRPTRTAPKAGV